MNRQSSIAPIEDWLGNFIAAINMVLPILLLGLIILVMAAIVLYNVRHCGLRGKNYTLMDYMRNILKQNKSHPEIGGTSTVKEQVEHGFYQMIRFANLAKNGHEFRGAQFGLNLGRTQELLGSYGGVDYWWRFYEPLIKARDWDNIMWETRSRLLMLSLPQPDEAFINRI